MDVRQQDLHLAEAGNRPQNRCRTGSSNPGSIESGFMRPESRKILELTWLLI